MNNHTEFTSIEILDVRKSYYMEQIKVTLIEVDHHEIN
jgi:hypothetical protein